MVLGAQLDRLAPTDDSVLIVVNTLIAVVLGTLGIKALRATKRS